MGTSKHSLSSSFEHPPFCFRKEHKTMQRKKKEDEENAHNLLKLSKLE